MGRAVSNFRNKGAPLSQNCHVGPLRLVLRRGRVTETASAERPARRRPSNEAGAMRMAATPRAERASHCCANRYRYPEWALHWPDLQVSSDAGATSR